MHHTTSTPLKAKARIAQLKIVSCVACPSRTRNEGVVICGHPALSGGSHAAKRLPPCLDFPAWCPLPEPADEPVPMSRLENAHREGQPQ